MIFFHRHHIKKRFNNGIYHLPSFVLLALLVTNAKRILLLSPMSELMRIGWSGSADENFIRMKKAMMQIRLSPRLVESLGLNPL